MFWTSPAQGKFQVINRWVHMVSLKQQPLLMEISTTTEYIYMIHVCRRTSPTVHDITKSTVITTITVGNKRYP